MVTDALGRSTNHEEATCVYLFLNYHLILVPVMLYFQRYVTALALIKCLKQIN